MPISQLDPVAALIVLDLPKGIVAMPTVHPAADIVTRSAQVARAFRARKLPVILVNVAGRSPGRTEMKISFQPPPDWAELVPELDRQPDDYAVTKLQVGAFYGTPLELILRRRGVTQVFLTGIATSIGVEATARVAFDHGYNVVTVTDAMTDRDPEAHSQSVEKVFPRIAERATTDEVIALLQSAPA